MLFKLCKKCRKEYAHNVYCDSCKKIVDEKAEKEKEKAEEQANMTDEQKKRERYKEYSKFNRDKKKQEFYSSKVWVRLRDTVKIKCKGLCLRCYFENNIIRSLDVIHHIISLDQDVSYALKEDNLIGLCSKHHMDTHHQYIISYDERVKQQEALFDYLDRWSEEYKEE